MLLLLFALINDNNTNDYDDDANDDDDGDPININDSNYRDNDDCFYMNSINFTGCHRDGIAIILVVRWFTLVVS